MSYTDAPESQYTLSEREEVFDEIVDEFKEAYSWWGEQLSQQALISLATHNIESDDAVTVGSKYAHTPRIRVSIRSSRMVQIHHPRIND